MYVCDMLMGKRYILVHFRVRFCGALEADERMLKLREAIILVDDYYYGRCARPLYSICIIIIIIPTSHLSVANGWICP